MDRIGEHLLGNFLECPGQVRLVGLRPLLDQPVGMLHHLDERATTGVGVREHRGFPRGERLAARKEVGLPEKRSIEAEALRERAHHLTLNCLLHIATVE